MLLHHAYGYALEMSPLREEHERSLEDRANKDATKDPETSYHLSPLPGDVYANSYKAMGGTPHAHQLNQWLSLALTVIVIGLIPWTTFLGLTLPARYRAHHWDLLWTGFDAALIGVLAYTAWAAWFRRQIMVATAIVAATMLFCDAWFDVVTSFGTGSEAVTLTTAFVCEIPLGIFFVWLARKIMAGNVEAFHKLAKLSDPPPSVSKSPILFSLLQRINELGKQESTNDESPRVDKDQN